MTRSLHFFVSMMMLLAGSAAAWAEPRIALIIGNGNYSSVTPLSNTVPDAALMARTLKEQGFTVTILTDADQAMLNQGISQFGRDLRAAGKDATGLFYYAGHAVQSFGSNYLLPTDSTLTDAADLSLVAVPADAVLRQMRSARNKTNIVILDACRNNPFKAIRDLNDNGLAEMNAPTGTFLSYSTAPGAVALDGLDGNSPFTKALARQIPKPGIPIEQTFKKVRVAVIEETDGLQTPWDTSSLTTEFMFEPKEALTQEQLKEEQLWASVKRSDDPVQIMLFLRGYPNGQHQEEARALLKKAIAAELSPQITAMPTPPPPVSTPTETVTTALVQSPTATEEQMIVAAQSSGAVAEYQAYLDAYPTGVYAELATFELTVQKDKADRAKAAAAEPVQSPTATEEQMIVAAQSSGGVAEYQAYLDAYPTGVYAELATFELTVLEDRTDRAKAAPAEPVQTAGLSKRTAAPAGSSVDLSVLTFKTPFPTGGTPIEGRSIEEIVKLSPLFPPIEGLPEELWKDKKCSACHQWTQQALCTHAKTYMSVEGSKSLSKQHPLGGLFKRGLKAWASADCP
jgi:hypothetical protein